MRVKFDIENIFVRRNMSGEGASVFDRTFRRIFSLIVAFTLVMSLFVVPEINTYAASGTASSPYIISSVQNLKDIRTNITTGTGNYATAYYKLACDITIPSDFTGLGEISDKPFKGTFDGDGYRITMSGGSPLFGYTSGATIKNAYFTGTVSGTGGVAGNATSTAFSGLDVDVSVTYESSIAGEVFAGVLAGDVTKPTVMNCALGGSATARSTNTDTGSKVLVTAGQVFGRINSTNVQIGSSVIGGYAYTRASETSNRKFATGLIAGSGYQIPQNTNVLNLDNWVYTDSGSCSLIGASPANFLGGMTSYTPEFSSISGSIKWKMSKYTYAADTGKTSTWVDYGVVNHSAPRSAFRSVLPDGTGSASNPCLISSVPQLQSIVTNINNKVSGYAMAHYKVTKNISLPSYFTPIGVSDYNFAGTFDGGGFTITSTGGTPLFGYTGSATIKNAYFTGDVTGTGGVVNNMAQHTRFDNLYVDTNVSNVAQLNGGEAYVGVLAKLAYDAAVVNCAVVGSASITAVMKESGQNYAYGAGALFGTTDTYDVTIMSSIIAPSLSYSASVASGVTPGRAQGKNGLISSSGYYYSASNSPKVLTLDGNVYTNKSSSEIDLIGYSPAQVLGGLGSSYSPKFTSITGGSIQYGKNLQTYATATGKTSTWVDSANSGRAYSAPVGSFYSKITPTINGDRTFNKEFGDEAFSLGQSTTSGGSLKYSSGNTNVATVDKDGKVTIKGVGTATITVKSVETDYYNEATSEVTVNVSAVNPDPPKFSVSSGQDKKAVISWTAPEFMGGQDISEYVIMRSTDGGKTYQKLYTAASMENNYTDTGLTNGRVYYYQMYTRTSGAAGTKTSVASDAAYAIPYTVPGAPSELKQVTATNTTISISFGDPLNEDGSINDGGDSIDEYVILVSDGDTKLEYGVDYDYTDDGLTESGEYLYTITGLTVNKTYKVAVMAINHAVDYDGGIYGGTAEIEASTWTTPDAPRNLKAEAADKNSIVLTWDEPEKDGGAPVESYIVQYRVKTDAPQQSTDASAEPSADASTEPSADASAEPSEDADTASWTVVTGVTERTYTVTGLEQGIEYEFTVIAVNESSADGGDASEIATAIPAQEPGAAVADDIISINSGVEFKNLSCADNCGDAVTEYLLYCRQAGETDYGEPIKVSADGEKVKSAKIEGLTNGLTYVVQVQAVNGYGSGVMTEPVEIRAGLPTTPKNLQILPQRGQQVTISYDPSDGQGTPIDHYELQVTRECGGELLHQTINTKNTQENYDASGSLNGEYVSVVVVAVSDFGPEFGEERWGRSLPTEAAITYVGAPSAPSITELTTNSTGVSLSWTASEHNGNALKWYHVYITDEEGNTSELRTADASVRSMTILTEGENSYPFVSGKAYTVKVACESSAGIGTLSKGKEFTFGTPEVPDVLPPSMDDREITVKWNKPNNDGGQEIIGYNIYLDDSDKAVATVTWQPTEDGKYQLYVEDKRDSRGPQKYGEPQDNLDYFEVTIGGLANGYSYTVKVTAFNANGEGRDDDGENSGTPATKADAPRDIIANATSGETASVSWNKPYRDGGSAIQSYTLVISKTAVRNTETGEYTDIDNKEEVFRTTVNTMNYDLTGLQPGYRYEAAVAAYTVAGDGAFGTEKFDTYSAPSKPVITDVVSGVGTALVPLTVTWDAPELDGGSEIIGYDVFVKGWKMNSDMLSADTREYIIRDNRITSGESSGSIVVVAYNAVTGTVSGVSSDPKTITVGTLPPPKNIIVDANVDGTVTIKWPMEQYTGQEGYINRFQIYENGTAIRATKTGLVELGLREMGKALKYEVTVYTELSDGRIEESNKSTPIVVIIGAPNTVTGINAVPGENLIDVAWDAVQMPSGFEPTKYNIYLDGGETPTQTVPAAQTTARIEGLEGGREYSVTVTAVNSKGENNTELESIMGEAVKVIPYAKPDAPKVSNIKTGVDSFSFDFTAPNGNGAEIKGYNVYVDNVKTEASIIGNTVTVTGVESRVNHTFYITAVNTYDLESEPPANAYEVVTGVPQAPENVRAVAGIGSATVSFSAVPDVSEEHKTIKYEVLNGDTVVGTAQSNGLESYDVLISGLSDGSAYTFTVRAVNDLGEGARSGAVTVKPGAPKAPVITKAVSGNGSLMLEWTEPESNSADISLYTVYVYVDDPANPGYQPMLDTPATNAKIENLDNGKEYKLVVTARNIRGEGAASEPITGIPGTTSGPISGINPQFGYENESCSIILGWNEPSDNGGLRITDYIVKSTGSNAVDDSNITVDALNRKAVVTGLAVGTKYEFAITPVNSGGEGAVYNTGELETLSQPGAVKLIGGKSSDRKIRFEWEKLTDQRTPVTGYKIYAEPAGGGDVISKDVPIPTNIDEIDKLSYSLTAADGIVVGGEYIIYVTAVNIVGEGEAGNQTHVWVSGDSAKTAPGAPQNLSVTPGDKCNTISWQPPLTDGGSTITGYIIYFGRSEDDMGPVTLTLPTVDGYTFEYKHEGLENDGAAYYYKVKAMNEISDIEGGEFSSVVSATPTQLYPPTKPTWAGFDNTAGTAAYETSARGTEVTFSWNASTDPAGLNVTYEVWVNGELKSETNETSYMLDVTDGGTVEITDTLYNVQIKAKNEQGATTPGDFIRARRGLNTRKGSEDDGFFYPDRYADGSFAYIDADNNGEEDEKLTEGTPSAPQNFNVTASGKQAVLTWMPPESNGNAEIDAYNVYINNVKVAQVPAGSSQPALVALDDDGSTFEYVSDIEYNTPYWFFVKAQNKNGEGASTQLKYIQESPTANAPENFTAQLKDDNKIELSWDETGGATGYMLYVDIKSSLDNEPIELTLSDVTVADGRVSYIYNGAINNTYTFMVAAKCESLVSPVSQKAIIDTHEPQADAPTGLKFESDTAANTVTVKWDAPANAQDANVKSYMIYVNGDTISVSAEQIESGGNSYTFEGIKTYYVRIAAVSANGTVGKQSGRLTFSEPAEQEEFETDTPPQPINLAYNLAYADDGILVPTDGLTLSWEPGTAADDHTEETKAYNVYIDGVIQNTEPVTDTTFTCTVSDDCIYTIKIQPVGMNDKVGPKAEITVEVNENVYTDPDKPTVNAELSADNSKITLTWTEDSSLVYYLMADGSYLTDSQTGERLAVHSGYEYEINPSDTKNYTFKLTAANTYSDGTVKTADSDTVSVNVGGGSELDKYKSNPPQLVQYISNQATKVKLFWRAPEPKADEENSIEEYKVTVGGEVKAVVAASDAVDGVYSCELDCGTAAAIMDKVAVLAYKTVNSNEFMASGTEEFKLTPNCNIVKNLDDYSNPTTFPVDVANVDADFDGAVDTAAKTITITGKTNAKDFNIEVIDEFDLSGANAIKASQVEYGEFNSDGTYDFTAVFPADNLQNCKYSIKFTRTAFTSYTITDVPSESLTSDTSPLTLNDVELYGGDLNSDGWVNANDKLIMSKNFGTNTSADGSTIGDLNNDGVTNNNDSLILSRNFNKESIVISWSN